MIVVVVLGRRRGGHGRRQDAGRAPKVVAARARKPPEHSAHPMQSLWPGLRDVHVVLFQPSPNARPAETGPSDTCMLACWRRHARGRCSRTEPPPTDRRRDKVAIALLFLIDEAARLSLDTRPARAEAWRCIVVLAARS